jgi:hypothetical protein
MLSAKTTIQLVPAHPVTEVFHCQMETASLQLKMILIARPETQSTMLAWSASMLTGSMAPDALLLTHFVRHLISKMANVSHATLATRLLVEAVESLSEIPTVKNTTALPTHATSAH